VQAAATQHGEGSAGSEEGKRKINRFFNEWQWWVIYLNSMKLEFGGAPAEVLTKTMKLGPAPPIF
jgi:hypothetical protein